MKISLYNIDLKKVFKIGCNKKKNLSLEIMWLNKKK